MLSFICCITSSPFCSFPFMFCLSHSYSPLDPDSSAGSFPMQVLVMCYCANTFLPLSNVQEILSGIASTKTQHNLWRWEAEAPLYFDSCLTNVPLSANMRLFTLAVWSTAGETAGSPTSPLPPRPSPLLISHILWLILGLMVIVCCSFDNIAKE